MTPLRVVVVDDEPLAQSYLSSILENHEDSECIACCSNGREAIACIRERQPDLVFLDIEMPGMNGFDVVKSIQSDILPLIIFATAYQAYAIDAFEVEAVDYVLKPFDPKRIEQALVRARERYTMNTIGGKQNLLAAMEQINSKNNRDKAVNFDHSPQKLSIKEDGVIKLIPYEDIDWIDAAGDYMCVHVEKNTHVLRCTMRELEQKLEDTSLVRIHRSTVVNLDKVQSLTPLKKGESELHLKDDVVLKVSRNYRKNIENLKH